MYRLSLGQKHWIFQYREDQNWENAYEGWKNGAIIGMVDVVICSTTIMLLIVLFTSYSDKNDVECGKWCTN